MNAVRIKNAPFGFDAMSGEVVDMFKAGIVEPLKVTRAALQNAASIGSLILTTETLVADKPEPKKEPSDARRRRHGRLRHDVALPHGKQLIKRKGRVAERAPSIF